MSNSLVRMPHSATGVEHSLSAEFYSRKETNLVVAGANVLRVFKLVPEEEPIEQGKCPKMRLECFSSWSLHSPITSMAKVSLPGSPRDTLILAFQEAKLSVVEYDPETHDLKTISLHIFEDEETRQGFVHNFEVPIVRADPDSRCAAMLVYGRQIIILPFKGDTISEKEANSSSASKNEEKPLGAGVLPSANNNNSKVLASYTVDLKSVIQTNNVDNIIDIQFLHGYNQPTLLILYEPLKTFSGRIAVRKDTCRLDVITLDVKERISAFIWSREVLPFDCIAALPVPKPIGGTLVFAVNTMFYLNQGMPPYGVALNSLGDRDVTTDIHVKPLEGAKISMDAAKAQFMSSERAVISLKGGELYVLTLLVDSMRMIRGFHVDKSAASVLTTCLTVCDDSYLFLGSRLGNSLLLQFTEKESGSLSLGSAIASEPPSKKKRAEEDIDFEVYGQVESASSTQISTFTFEVCDSLLNIGPCGNVTMGEPAFLSEEFASSVTPDPDVELVTTSGHGKNGALCVLQQNVRPQVVTTLELPGCNNVWTVIGDASSDISDGHAYLILSRQDSTMILRTEQEINQLDKSGFYTEGPTIFTGNLGGNKYIVQVLEKDVRLLYGSELVTSASFNESIVSASSADPHLLLLTDKGQLILVSLDVSSSVEPKLTIIRSNQRNTKSQMRCVTAYKDVSGVFTSKMEPEDLIGARGGGGGRGSSLKTQVIENEDDLLYGDSAPEAFTSALSSLESTPSATRDKKNNWVRYFTQGEPTFWALGVRDNGDLEIYSLPNFTLKFSIANFNLGAKVCSHQGKNNGPLDNNSTPMTEDAPKVTELLLVSLGSEPRKRPMLMARLSDAELLMYEAIPYCDFNMEKNALKMKFYKLNHGLILRERRSKSKKDGANIPKGGAYKHTLQHFPNVGGYEGVFVGGPYPHWILLTGRGELRRHPMGIDGSIPLFAPFHNVNCPNGFIYFNRKGELRICVLPTHLSYDAPWPVRKVPLRCTPHFITYHLDSKTYAVVTSVSEVTQQFWKFNGDDKELRDEERSDRFPWPSKDRFFVQLFSPVSWEPIPGTKIQLDEWERCTSMKHLYLSSEGLHTGQRGYIVISTSFCYGEDVTPRGYIRIYDVIEVIPEPGQPLTKNKIKTVYDKEQKGPITAISSVNGFLVATVGQKIYIFQFKNKDLFGVAFIDSQIYIHQLACIKNFILVGDVMKSVDLLQFQQDYRTLSIISRDTKPLEVFSCEYLVDNGSVGFLVTDADKNIFVFTYQPEARESAGGTELLRKADFNLGQHISSIFRIRAKLSEPSSGNRILTGWEKRHVTWFATLDGGLGYILPINEKMYRRLLTLQNMLISAIPHIAGLNPKSSRLVRTRRRDLQNPCRGMIDADLVYHFTDLPFLQKLEISKKIGTKLSELLDDLGELDRMAAHF